MPSVKGKAHGKSEVQKRSREAGKSGDKSKRCLNRTEDQCQHLTWGAEPSNGSATKQQYGGRVSGLRTCLGGAGGAENTLARGFKFT